MPHQLRAENVTRKFGRKTILEGISLTFDSGRIYGFVGENGSGKTVFMKMLIGLMKTTNGEICYDNRKLKKDFDFLPSVGFIIENPGFYPEMTGFDNLKTLAEIRGIISDEQIREWIRKVGLKDNGEIVDNYSLGMIQRLGIAQALMEDPEVIILDEVTNSLDEQGTALVYELLRQQKQQGKIIIISSHIKKDIEELCDEVYRFQDGGIICEKKE